MKNFKLPNLMIVFALTFLVSCSKDDSTPPVNTVKSITVTANKTTFTPGEAIIITVKTDKGKDVTSTSKILIDGVSATSPYKAPATEGIFKIKATYKGVSNEVTITVKKAVAAIIVTANKTVFSPKEAMTMTVVKTDTGKDVTSDSKILMDGKEITKPYKAPAKMGDHKIKATYKTFSNEITIKVAQTTAIPDAKFEEYLRSKGWDGTGDTNDGQVLTSKINTITKLDIKKGGFTDLTGIKDFKALTSLQCRSNKLTSLDVSKNTALTHLGCNYNQLTKLDVSKNTALTQLGCGGNQLTSLDVSKNTALARLYCSGNQLTSLDVSKNTALIWLSCTDSNLTSLDLTKNTALKWLSCINNNLTSLNVSKNTALTNFYPYDNKLTSLDVSKNTALTELYCGNNQLTDLDVSKNTALTKLSCYTNKLTSLNVSKNTALTMFFCNDNQLLTSLDIRNGNNNKLTSANISFMANLNLTCILVDNKTYSDENWKTKKDDTAKYIEKEADCK